MLHLPGGDVLAPEWHELADRVVNGDGLGWAGDPRLELRIGVIKYRGRTGRRLEVWRTNEDGSVTPLAHWHPREQYAVCYDLAQMSGAVQRPGSVEDAGTRIDRANEAREDAVRRQDIDRIATDIEREAYRLVRSQGHARTTFQVDGRREEAPRAE